MKNWKKLLACLLVSLMALTVFTACDASVGAPMGAKRSTAESAKALCDRFKVSYSEELSDKAYTIASWVAGTEQSCKPSEGKTELYRWASIDKVAEVKTCLEQQRYATAFENMGMGIFWALMTLPRALTSTARCKTTKRISALFCRRTVV